jgi:hypothetical protein
MYNGLINPSFIAKYFSYEVYIKVLIDYISIRLER